MNLLSFLIPILFNNKALEHDKFIITTSEEQFPLKKNYLVVG